MTDSSAPKLDDWMEEALDAKLQLLGLVERLHLAVADLIDKIDSTMVSSNIAAAHTELEAAANEHRHLVKK